MEIIKTCNKCGIGFVNKSMHIMLEEAKVIATLHENKCEGEKIINAMNEIKDLLINGNEYVTNEFITEDKMDKSFEFVHGITTFGVESEPVEQEGFKFYRIPLNVHVHLDGHNHLPKDEFEEGYYEGVFKLVNRERFIEYMRENDMDYQLGFSYDLNEEDEPTIIL